MVAAHRAITSGRMVAVAPPGFPASSNLRTSLKDRLVEAPLAEWALAKVEGVVYKGELYQVSELEVEEDKQMMKQRKAEAKRKKGGSASGRAAKGQKGEKGMCTPTLMTEEPPEDAPTAVDIARRQDVLVRVSWWGAKDQWGKVRAIHLLVASLQLNHFITLVDAFENDLRCLSQSYGFLCAHAQVSLTGVEGGGFVDLHVVDDVPRAHLFYMDSSTKLFRLTKAGQIQVPTVKAMFGADLCQVPAPGVGASRSLIWEASLNEVKGYKFTQRARDESSSRTFIGA